LSFELEPFSCIPSAQRTQAVDASNDVVVLILGLGADWIEGANQLAYIGWEILGRIDRVIEVFGVWEVGSLGNVHDSLLSGCSREEFEFAIRVVLIFQYARFDDFVTSFSGSQ